MKIMNLHVHTSYSDGLFSPREVIEAAIKSNIKILGICDHYETKKTRSIKSSHIEKYISELRSLSSDFSKYIEIKIGLEIDSSKERTSFKSLPYEITENLDFVLFEYVNMPKVRGMKLDEAAELSSKFLCPVGLAHNDITANFHNMSKLVSTLEDSGIFIELSSGLRNNRDGKPYYRHADKFFELLKDKNIKLSVGSDAHRYLNEISMVKDAYEFIASKGLIANLLYR